MRYAVATSEISDTPTLEWGNGAYLSGNKRNIFLDIVSRPNIAYECKVVKNLSCLYQGCGRLREITPLWDSALVTNISSAFSMCKALERADLSHLDLTSVKTIYDLFYECIVLIDVKLPSLPSVNICSNAFAGCTSLQSVELPPLPSVTGCSQMFIYCTSLQSVTLHELPSLVGCSFMFLGCASLHSITLPSLPSAQDFTQMFALCSSLQSITLPELPAVTNCTQMFLGCSSLQSLYLDMPNCTNFTNFANGCSALHTVEIVDVRKASELTFDNCLSLQNVTCVEELPKCKISFSSSSKLTLESVTNIITHLPDLSAEDSKTLTLHATTKALLTETLIAEATNKNWIIA